jgi:tetratricopeptide (TPR) repeat protein
MRHTTFIAFLSTYILFFVLAGTAAPLPQTAKKGAEHNRKGMQLYNDAFYNQLPQGKRLVAERLFDLAAGEFKNAIAENPEDAEAYRNLARLHYVQKQYLEAAHAYETLTSLQPHDIDTYVQLALCYIKLDRNDEAIRTLETAKTESDDPEVIVKLNEYIRKIEARRQD